MIDLFGYLETMRYRYDLRTADIWNGFFLSTEDEYLGKIKKGLQERELELANLCVDGAHIWEEEADTRKSNHQNALAYLHAAEVLNAKTVRIDAGGRDEQYSNEQFDLIVKRYKEYAQRAYDNGFRVGPENHWGTELNPDIMRQICEAVDHPGFGVLIHFKDTGEVGEHGERIQLPEYAGQILMTEKMRRVIDQIVIFIRRHIFPFDRLESLFRRNPMARPGIELVVENLIEFARTGHDTARMRINVKVQDEFLIGLDAFVVVIHGLVRGYSAVIIRVMARE